MSSTSYTFPDAGRSYLVCSTPIHGHVTPLLSAARALVQAGNDVRFLTGVRYRAAVEETGARWIGLPEDADFDDRDIDAAFPGRIGRRGVDAARWDLRHIFLDPAPSQLRAVDAQLSAERTDAVLTESLFLGAMLLLCRPGTDRPPVVNLGIVPLGLRSRDTAPFALGLPPLRGPLGPVRNALLAWSTERFVFADLQKAAEQMCLAEVGAPLSVPVMNYPAAADAIVQFTVPEFEYPRPDVTVPVHFVGPVSLATASTVPLPEWWGDLDGRRVVHVTQGTIANADIDGLILPTMRALADRDVLVVASLGGREVPASLVLPANARIASYLPYDRLFPRTDVFVTNGGYGGVHFALAHGVPIVAAGDTEDKAEVSARVAWSGAGVRVRPGASTTDPRRIRRAVDLLLAEPSYRDNARRIGASITASPGPAGIDPVLRALVGSTAH